MYEVQGDVLQRGNFDSTLYLIHFLPNFGIKSSHLCDMSVNH